MSKVRQNDGCFLSKTPTTMMCCHHCNVRGIMHVPYTLLDSRHSTEFDIAKQIDFDSVIRSFSRKKARKATLFS